MLFSKAKHSELFFSFHKIELVYRLHYQNGKSRIMMEVHVLCLGFISSNLGYLTSAFTSELVTQFLSSEQQEICI